VIFYIKLFSKTLLITLNSFNFIKKFMEEYNKYNFLKDFMSVYTKTKEHVPLKHVEKNVIPQGE